LKCGNIKTVEKKIIEIIGVRIKLYRHHIIYERMIKSGKCKVVYDT